MLNDVLDIYLITYNRKPYLETLLKQLVADNSPIKDVDIKIVDNNSNDGTTEMLKELAISHPNIKHIKNNRNIGLAGNLCKAMELAGKKYYWILCDNDEIDFSAWNEIQKAMDENYDLIMTCTEYNCDKVTDKRAFALAQSTFTPSCIYKTEFLTDDIMTYAMADIPTILPHVCAACKIVNENGSIFIPSQTIIKQASNIVVKDIKSYNFDRISANDSKRYVHIRTHGLNFPVGILSSFDSLKDKDLRNYTRKLLMNHQLLNGYGPFIVPSTVVTNYFVKHNMPLYMLLEFIQKCPLKELLKHLSPIRFYCSKGFLRIQLLWVLKTKICKIRKSR